ncbi:glycosyltransferase [Flavobacterium croceum]|uniref:glycosyltransferase n=1 Tax=Flavobacterium croceum TaxID=370975 RepID=UPI0024A7D4CF|nr:glycosyltransferase [Flavobacterium croceum]
MSSITKHIICLTPVYNDWESFSMLISNIEKTVSKSNYTVQVVVVNDGSLEEFQGINNNQTAIEILDLKTNIGHQRAIAVGLQYINDNKNDFDYVIVLDSDGEDRPEDILKLIKKCETVNNNKIIFAQRNKRQESLTFRIGYYFYKIIFNWLTGQTINFGNFSCIPHKLVKRVAIQDNLWNHYSGSIIQSKTPFDKVLLDRGKRYAGTSKMNFTNLVLHGLSSISVYFDSLSVRILKLSIYGIFACLLSVLVILYKKFITGTAIPGWASSLLFVIFSIILQLSSVTLIVLLMQLSSRKNIKSPSVTVYKDFVEKINYISNGKSN